MPESGKTSLRAALILLVLLLAVPGVALAGSRPLLLGTSPRSEGAVRSEKATIVIAVYDRDLDEYQSRMTVSLVTGSSVTPVAGDVDLCNPDGEIPGQQAICFRPNAPMAEGAYRAQTHVHPRVGGDPTETVWNFRVDDTAPAAPVVTDPLTGQVRTDQPLYAKGTAEAGATMVVMEGQTLIAQDRASSQGVFSVRLPYPPEDGVTHTFELFARDEAGNVSPGSGAITIYHDSIVLIPVITAPAEGAYLNTATVTVAGTAKPGSTVTVREGAAAIGTAPVNANGLWSVPIGFAAGTHTITATSFDGVMNDGPSDARTFTVDVTAPAAPVITTPAAGATLNTTGVVVSGTAEPLSTVKVREGTLVRATVQASAAGAWSATIDFVDGPHTVTATATDRAGNVSAAASRSFSVDTAEPPIPLILTPAEDAFLNASAVAISGNTEANAIVEILRGTVLIGTTVANGAGGFALTLTFPDGAHTITAVAVDAGGNRSEPSIPRSFTVDTAAPSAPVITDPEEGATVGVNEVKVRGTAEPSSNVTVREGAAVIGATVADGEGNWTVTITFANGPHAITARATDIAGNVSAASALRSFTVASTGDVTAPATPVLIDPAAGSSQPSFVLFRGTAEAGSTVRIYEGSTLLGHASAPAGTFEIGAALGGGTHTVTATATDPSGNESPPTAPRTFVVDALRPVVSIDTPDNHIFLPLEPVLITGAAQDNDAVVDVELEIRDLAGDLQGPYYADCAACPSPSSSWEATLDLGVGTYEVIARAVDAAGNRSTPARIRIYVV